MPDIRVTTELDDFTREELPEYPLSHSGDWGGATSSDTFNFAPMQVKGSHTGPPAVQGIATHPNFSQLPTSARRFANSYWVHPFSTSQGDIEVWGEPIGGNSSGIAWSLGLWKNPGGYNTLDGYFFRQEVSTGGGSTRLYRYDNGSRTAIASGSSGFTGAFPNYGFLMRITSGGLITCYSSKDATSTWTLKISTVDLTYTGTFYLGLGVTDNSASTILGWYNFGGGVPERKRSQIYRWLHSQKEPTDLTGYNPPT